MNTDLAEMMYAPSSEKDTGALREEKGNSGVTRSCSSSPVVESHIFELVPETQPERIFVSSGEKATDSAGVGMVMSDAVPTGEGEYKGKCLKQGFHILDIGAEELHVLRQEI